MCNFCGTSIQNVVDTGDNGLVCTDCGFVVEEKSFDHGPEWRYHDKSTRNRVGQTLSVGQSHDTHMTTRISYYSHETKTKNRTKTQQLINKHKGLLSQANKYDQQTQEGINLFRQCCRTMKYDLTSSEEKIAFDIIKQLLAIYRVVKSRPRVNDNFWSAVFFYTFYLIHKPTMSHIFWKKNGLNSDGIKSVKNYLKQLLSIIHGRIDNEAVQQVQMNMPCQKLTTKNNRFKIPHLMVYTPVTDLVTMIVKYYDFVPKTMQDLVLKYCHTLTLNAGQDIGVITHKEQMISAAERRALALVRIATNDLICAHFQRKKRKNNRDRNSTKNFQHTLVRLKSMSTDLGKSATTISNEVSHVRRYLENENTTTTTTTTKNIKKTNKNKRKHKPKTPQIPIPTIPAIPAVIVVPNATTNSSNSFCAFKPTIKAPKLCRIK